MKRPNSKLSPIKIGGYEISIKALLISGFVASVFVLVGITLTSAAYELKLVDKVKSKLASVTETTASRGDSATFTWKTLETGLETISTMEIPFGKTEGVGAGGAIEEFQNNLIYVTPLGKIGFIDPTNGLISYFENEVPMNFEDLSQSDAWQATNFNRSWFRVGDILITNESERDWLYVNHHIFLGDRICTRVSRIVISKEDNRPRLIGDWETFYEVDPCGMLSPDNYEFAGHMTAGRMIENTDGSILMTVGDFGMGHWEPENFPNGHSKDWSTLLKLDPTTKQSEIMATGFRNAQGLNIDEQGRIWSTEHGPQGGDEVNIVALGKHHGWPNVSLGMHYADSYNPRNDIYENPIQGRHEGYEKPVTAFIPSIGISQILPVPTDSPVFELWRGDMLFVSMREQTLFRMRLDGDRAVSIEPIRLDRRMRDIIRLKNNRLAILTDDKSIIIIKDPEHDEGENITLAGYAPINEMEQSVRTQAGHEWRRDMFRFRCGACHSVDGSENVAPSLAGIVGREIASVEGYPYSAVLDNASGVWTEDKIEKFATHPDAAGLTNSNMPRINTTPDEIKGIIDYLKTVE